MTQDAIPSILKKIVLTKQSEVAAAKLKKDLNDINKFLLASSRENTKINIDYKNGFLSVIDTEKINQFGLKGESIYFNSLGFLLSNGLKDYINTLINN